MKFLLFSLVTLLHVIPSKLQACGKFSFNTGLVVNGDEVKRGEFPFLVALLKLKTQKFFCGASLITQKHALTGETGFFSNKFVEKMSNYFQLPIAFIRKMLIVPLRRKTLLLC